MEELKYRRISRVDKWILFCAQREEITALKAEVEMLVSNTSTELAAKDAEITKRDKVINELKSKIDQFIGEEGDHY